MGVFGLWRLLDSTGKPVPLETLEGKVLAIDVSIWIHQVLQGYQDRHGQAKPNAHLLGLYHRICKLLYFKIKPVFVFDGGVPMLKRRTIASRREQKSIATSKAQKMKTDLINNLIKHSAVKTVLNKENANGESSSSQCVENILNKKPNYDMFELPEMSSQISEYITDDENDTDSSVELSPRKQTKWMGNIHSVDVSSNEFKTLPADVRYDILTDLKETRKQNSWGRLHEMPKESNDFSSYQMKRLLKRRLVQESLESAEKEMGGKTLTLEELEKLLTDQGVQIGDRDPGFRIASDNITRLIYISDKNALIKQAEEEANKKQEEVKATTESENVNGKDIEPIAGPSFQGSILENIHDYDFDDDWRSDDQSQDSSSVAVIDNIQEYEFDSDWDSNNESLLSDTDNKKEIELNESQTLAKKYFGKNSMNAALTYMLEYSGLTQNEVIQLIEKKRKNGTANVPTRAKEKEKIENFKTVSDSVKNIDSKTLQMNKEALMKVDSCVPSVSETKCDSNKPCSSESANTFLRQSKVAEIEENPQEVECSSDSDDLVEITENTSNSFNIKRADSCTDLPSMKENAFQEKLLDRTINIKINDTIDTESNTDSDDFIEIKDVPIPDVLQIKAEDSKSGIQITINSDTKLEDDDMFADIFSKNGSDTRSANFDELMQSVKMEKASDSLMSNSNHVDSKTPLCIILEKEGNEANMNDSMVVTEQKNLQTTESVNGCTAGTEQESLQATESVEKSQTAKNEKLDTEKNVELHRQNMPVESDLSEETNTDNTAKVVETTNEVGVIDAGNKTIEKLPVLPVNEDELMALKAQLEDEQEELSRNIGKLDRQATDISGQIRREAQELLRLFGLPYIVAPMEAEAQCAFLEQINLTDGTITDDSDIWLFGGKCVYKNFFNHKKRVLQFRSCDIEHHFKLTRNEMIQLALLVGSDYTIGVPGIGPVTALEIIAAFPCKEDNLLRGLMNFSKWIKLGGTIGTAKAALRNKLRNVKIEKGFPSQAVVQAYLFPTVDESKETFTWGKPNIVLLADYVRTKFGWTKSKFEDIMGPVIKRLEKEKSQKLIDAYFTLQTIPKSIEPNLSKRVAKAVRKLHNADANESDEGTDKAKGTAKTQPERTKRAQKPNSTDNKSASMDVSTNNVHSTASGAVVSSDVTVASPVSSKNVDPAISNTFSIDEKPSAPKIPKLVDEYIPQREKDKANALKKKLHAIEVFRKSKQGLSKTRRVKRSVRKIVKEAALSEDSSSSS